MTAPTHTKTPPVRLDPLVPAMAVTPVETDVVIGSLIAVCDNLLTVLEDEGLGGDEVMTEARALLDALDPAQWYRRAGLLHPDMVEFVR